MKPQCTTRKPFKQAKEYKGFAKALQDISKLIQKLKIKTFCQVYALNHVCVDLNVVCVPSKVVWKYSSLQFAANFNRNISISKFDIFKQYSLNQGCCDLCEGHLNHFLFAFILILLSVKLK